jgi:hypothetical protein
VGSGVEPHREEWHQLINTNISLIADYKQQQQLLIFQILAWHALDVIRQMQQSIGSSANNVPQNGDGRDEDADEDNAPSAAAPTAAATKRENGKKNALDLEERQNRVRIVRRRRPTMLKTTNGSPTKAKSKVDAKWERAMGANYTCVLSVHFSMCFFGVFCNFHVER